MNIDNVLNVATAAARPVIVCSNAFDASSVSFIAPVNTANAAAAPITTAAVPPIDAILAAAIFVFDASNAHPPVCPTTVFSAPSPTVAAAAAPASTTSAATVVLTGPGIPAIVPTSIFAIPTSGRIPSTVTSPNLLPSASTVP